MEALFRPTLQLVVPVLLGGLLHVAAIKAALFPALAARPIDFGLQLRGRRVFGANKTWRGVLVMVGATAIAGAGLSRVSRVLPWPLTFGDGALEAAGWGALLGLGYIVGELPNSFFKRQLDIAPGANTAGAAGRVFWVIDQIDSLAGVLLVVWIVRPVPVGVALVLVAVTLVLHPTIAFLMVRLGLKSRVG